MNKNMYFKCKQIDEENISDKEKFEKISEIGREIADNYSYLNYKVSNSIQNAQKDIIDRIFYEFKNGMKLTFFYKCEGCKGCKHCKYKNDI